MRWRQQKHDVPPLDERALADIGFKRSEIESAVFGSPSDRLRRYDPTWRLHDKG